MVLLFILSYFIKTDQDTPNSDTEYSMQNPYKDFEDLHEGDEDIIDDELVLTKILINGSDNEVVREMKLKVEFLFFINTLLGKNF